MKLAVRWLTLIVLTIVQYACFLFFAKGFFPQKVLLPGINSFESVQTAANSSVFDRLYKNVHTSSEQVLQEKFEKLIFVVIDALRSDFVFSSNSSMSKLHSLLNSNAAIGFTGFSNPPTVTLPRLKALTTGSISSFLDAILNINEADTSSSSSLVNQDSWLKQFILRNNPEKLSKINFFGDDTWLKLFPDFFNEYEGTSSFFVSDFTEVDTNVTRHIEPQLAKDSEWDGLILHYLGLDHIGHKNGPNSVFMPGKQEELDSIIYDIYNNYAVPKYENDNQKTLMVVLGDHGMNEIGNHGGSSISETSAALVFLSPVFQQLQYLRNDQKVPIELNENYQFLESINQMDLIPTLCSLFNLPIPKNNLGILLKKFLSLEDKSPQSYNKIFFKLLENAYQFKNLIEIKFGKNIRNQFETSKRFNDDSVFEKLDSLWHDSVLKFEYLYIANNNLFSALPHEELINIVDAFYAFLTETQDFLQSSSTDYNLPALVKSISILAVVTSILVTIFVQNFTEWNLLKECGFFAVFIILMGGSTFASSMVEEEHQIWWFFSLIYLLFVAAGLITTYYYTSAASQKTGKMSPLITLATIMGYLFTSLILFRAIRFWNNSGQKFNFADEFNQLKLSYYLSYSQYQNVALFILIAVILIHSQLLSTGGLNLIHPSVAFVVPFTVSMIILSFKINFEYVNTGGKNFNEFFKQVVQKTGGSFVTDEDDTDAVKNMLITLAQTAFKALAGLSIIRLVLLKVKYLWFSDTIETDKVEWVTEEPEAGSTSRDSIRKQLRNKPSKRMVTMKKISKKHKTYITGKYKFLSDISNLLALFLIMQTKLENVGLYFVFFILREVITKLINRVIKMELAKLQTENNMPADNGETAEKKSVTDDIFEEIRQKAQLISDKKLHYKLAFYISLLTLFLQNMTFFQFAFTNSLSTVDLANAYNGTRSYNLLLVGILTFVSNFSSTLYWSVNSLIWLYDNNLVNSGKGILFFPGSVKWDIFYVRYLVNFTFYTVFGLFLCVACYNLRFHLFIWTVFSPKLLFFGVWNFLVNGVMEAVIALLLFLYN